MFHQSYGYRKEKKGGINKEAGIDIYTLLCIKMGFPIGSVVKTACSAGDVGSIPGTKIPWRRTWLPTPVFLPGKFHGQRSLTGNSPGLAKSRT